MATVTKKRPAKATKNRFIGKPNGHIQERVRSVGPEHFGIVSVDCAKQRSKWMLCDFYGKVIIEPTVVEHNASALKAMTDRVKAACQEHKITDSIIAVEMTGIYHRPVQRAFRKAGFDTRTVHPFASKHYRRPLHPDCKTDDHDLEAIFHAAINGYGLATLPVDENYQTMQLLARHRRNLVKQRARLQVQIRRFLHQTMPGYADLFDEDNFFNKSIAIHVALLFPSPVLIRKAGSDGIATKLKQSKIRFQPCTIDRIVAWAATADEPATLSTLLTTQWQQLNSMRITLSDQIEEIEREMAHFLVKTPYVVLLSVTGINVVSAAGLAGEAGPIEHYASVRALNGRAGLYPSRYQSDEVDHADGSLVRQCNRKLRAAAMMIAENLIKCHPHYRGLSALWMSQRVDSRDRRCRIANRAMRMVYQLVAGRQLWHGKGVDRDYLLHKLHEFHRVHSTPIVSSISDMTAAIEWLPKSSYEAESAPLVKLASKRSRGPQQIGDLMLPLLIRLGVRSASEVESESSEARSSN